MSIQAVAWAIKQKTGSPIAKCLLMACANYANENGRAWPSQDTLAVDCDMSARTVREWLKVLEEQGLIQRERRSDKRGHRLSDYIILSLPADSSDRAQPTGSRASSLPADPAGTYKDEPSEDPKARARAGETFVISPDAHAAQWTAWLAHFEREKSSKAKLMHRTADGHFRNKSFTVPSEWPPVSEAKQNAKMPASGFAPAELTSCGAWRGVVHRAYGQAQRGSGSLRAIG